MISAKVTTIGTSSGIIFNKEAMAKMRLKKGDTVFLTEAPDGGFRITAYDPEFERQNALAEDIMHEDREVLRALSK
ncbi:MAG: transcriptional regulator [Alphaproteobacteria bacterium]